MIMINSIQIHKTDQGVLAFVELTPGDWRELSSDDPSALFTAAEIAASEKCQHASLKPSP